MRRDTARTGRAASGLHRGSEACQGFLIRVGRTGLGIHAGWPERVAGGGLKPPPSPATAREIDEQGELWSTPLECRSGVQRSRTTSPHDRLREWGDWSFRSACKSARVDHDANEIPEQDAKVALW